MIREPVPFDERDRHAGKLEAFAEDLVTLGFRGQTDGLEQDELHALGVIAYAIVVRAASIRLTGK